MSERIAVPDEDIEILMLAESHTDIIRNFDSYSKELNEYLAEEALRDQKVYISKTFLFMHMPDKELTGYITLLTDSIKIKGTIIHEQFLEKGIGYHWMPALKIGRLCVDRKYEGRGIGTKMVLFAIKMSERMNETIAGCRFITVDAKRNERALNLYSKTGFSVSKERKGETIAMYLDIRELE